MAATVERLLDSWPFDGGAQTLTITDDRGVVRAHWARRPDRMDRRDVNPRLRQYARGDRDGLFGDAIGG
jgi:hypothetical protein